MNSSIARKPRILICDDDPVFIQTIKLILSSTYEIESVSHCDQAIAYLSRKIFDLMILDIQLRSSHEGLNYIEHFRSLDPQLTLVVMSGRSDYKTVRAALKKGAHDYIAKDAEPEEISIAIQRALAHRDLLRQNEQARDEIHRTHRRFALVGQSQATQKVRQTIEKLRQTHANVLITGESGTGKEIVARHLRSSDRPFVAIDSSTIQSSMAESLLFGYEAGAFTGATRSTPGLFEKAHEGIIYFDEISNMPLDIQTKLLRVLQEKEVRRLGSHRVIPLNFRVVCATNQDLEKKAAQGGFQYDLLQRLNVIPFDLPPLRDRPEDIPTLIEHFILKGQLPRRLTFLPETLEYLQDYDWPGNIRELENLVTYLGAMAEGNEIDISDLPPRFRDRVEKKRKSNSQPSETLSFYDQISAFEAEVLNREYAKASGNISQMAIRLGMDRSHLYTKLKRFGIHPLA